MKLSCLVLLFFTGFLGTASGHFTGKGHVHILEQTKQDFWNRDCRARETCDLKRFTLATSVYEVWFSDDPNYPTYGNGAIMEYETNSVAALEKYAIVQFKKGCVFYTSKDGQSKINKNATDVVTSFGEQVPLCFPKWVIDSQDTDPVYNSDPENGRFYMLRWNEPGSYDDQTEQFYGVKKPETPVVYMADYPAGAFVTGTGIKNVALEFRTCIYKAREVPSSARRNDLHFANPIGCLDWQNVYVYDFSTGRFQTDLAYAPKWEEPAERVNWYLLALVALCVALALLAFSRFTGFRHFRRKDATTSQP
jgi:hypothetical protein